MKHYALKGTKEAVAERMYEVAEDLKKIADKILEEKYDPRDWQEVADKFKPVESCLQVQAIDFMREREDIKVAMNANGKDENDL